MPLLNYKTLKFCTELFREVANHQPVNKMSAEAIAMRVGPLFFSTNLSKFANINYTDVFLVMMRHFNQIFTRSTTAINDEDFDESVRPQMIKQRNPIRDYEIRRRNKKDDSYLAVSKRDNMMYTMKSISVD